MGRAWARNLISNAACELVGWVDIDESALADALQEVRIEVPTSASLRDLVPKVAPDFVVDVTVPEAHCSVTLAALELGLPVLGEKPMASTLDEARRMVAASERAGKLYMVSQSRRYNPGIRAYRKLIQEQLGELGILNSDFYIGPHFGGFRDAMNDPLLLDMAIHTFDAARFLSSADPVSVYAEAFNPSWSWYAGNACANVLFEMSGGIRFAYRGSWCAEGCKTSWESEWRAIGRNGTARWDGERAPYAEVVESPEGFVRECRRIEGEHWEGPCEISGSLSEFLGALESGQTPNGECHDNFKSLAMVLTAIESARAGTRLMVPSFS